MKRTGSVASLGSGVRVGVELEPADSKNFKIPSAPVPRAGKERAHSMDVDRDDEDVFGSGMGAGGAGSGESKGAGGNLKRKRGADESEAETQMEKANKTIIKQSATHLLALSLPKSHPEYKDVYGAVYRGVGFALRTTLKKSAVDLKTVERLVRIHVNMYVPGDARAAAGGSGAGAGAGGGKTGGSGSGSR
ncbi:VPS9 domain-containing protein [Mycena sanguinolenta]|uniref:VPS9 domain-containing protein n=1 Tax=Mycena sanguinolenta TaxID=230812 RepID=A0A8H6U184_9AGAR|nr:VPS9 domain-containing protein [Mycena sanguinolenta]